MRVLSETVTFSYRMSMELREPITYIAKTNHRRNPRIFGIKQSDRFFHMYVIGRTGTGKTTLLESLALQDIRAGRGLAMLDPHGDLVARLAASIPAHRAADLVYFDAPNPSQPYGYNPLGGVCAEDAPLAASGLLSAFEKIWTGREWGSRMGHVLRNALFALIEYGDATLPDILRLLSDETYRKHVVGKIKNPQVRTFWLSEYAKYPPPYRQQAIAPIQSKVGAFLADPRLYRIFTMKESIDLRGIMDQGKILLVNLAKGALGEDSGTNVLGALLVSTLNLAAFSRIDVPEAERRDFIIYLDEFQNYLSLSMANMVSELRKFRIGIVAAHQHLAQLEDDVRHAVLGNVGTMIAFRIGPEDARTVAREFEPQFEAPDLIDVPNYTIRIKLMIDGAPSRAFSAVTLTPQELEEKLRTPGAGWAIKHGNR